MTAYANVGDYFYINKVLANWLVGHVGSSDWNHVYWPLLYQIAMSENEDTATTLFQTATDMIEKDGSASVDTCLIDGVTALFAATKKTFVLPKILTLMSWVYLVEDVSRTISGWE